MSDTKAAAQRFAAVEIEEIRAQLVAVENARIASNRGEPYEDYVREEHKLFRMFDPLHTRHQAAVSAFVALADSIPGQIEAAVQAEREKWEKVRNAGALLSNVAYNLSQQAGRVITEHDAELSRQCSDQWDAAIRARGEANRG